MIHFKETKNKSALSTRWLQMSKQEQIIEKKKMEIQAKLEAQKQAAALAAQAKLSKYVLYLSILSKYTIILLVLSLSVILMTIVTWCSLMFVDFYNCCRH